LCCCEFGIGDTIARFMNTRVKHLAVVGEARHKGLAQHQQQRRMLKISLLFTIDLLRSFFRGLYCKPHYHKYCPSIEKALSP